MRTSSGSAARRSLPLIVAAIAFTTGMLAWTAAAVAAPDPDNSVSFTLEGCNNDGTLSFPDVNGDFVCPDTAYTTGNMGKNWAELDLVPFRVTTTEGASGPGTSYAIVISVVAEDNGVPGYDFISEATVNPDSDPSCSITSGPEIVTGTTEKTRYRVVTISQDAGTTCYFDYYARLAIGASGFPGSSLHSNLYNQSLGEAGVGKRAVSINPKEVAPQELTKDMSARQDSDHAWNVTKSPSPASVDFGNTCDPNTPRQAPVSITVTWTKLAATPSGDITVITNIYATNPASREISVTVDDDIRSGTTVLDHFEADSMTPVVVPSNTQMLVLTHTTTVPAGTANLNDVATGHYVDTATGIVIPQTTTATATASVQAGDVLNSTATIDDLESITGAGYSYSADSFSGASGAFGLGYIAGTPTTGNVGWTSTSQSGSGSVTFAKTVYIAAATSGSGTLSDTATLTASDGFTTNAGLNIGLSASPTVELTIKKNIPGGIIGTGESQTFTFDVKSGATVVASPTITFGPGETTDTVTVSGLNPGSYTVSERQEADWPAVPDPQNVNLNLPTCSQQVEFTNSFNPAAARAVKVTVPSGGTLADGWAMKLSGPGTPVGGETVSTVNGVANFTTALEEGSYTITETAKSGWDQTGTSGDCSFTVSYPADNDELFTCTITNTQRGNIVVKKETLPDGSSQSFEFDPSYGSNFFLTDGQSNDSGAIVPDTYSVGEVNVPAGWDLTSATCDDGSPVTAIALGAGETVTCTFNNRQRGTAKVVKTVSGAAPSGVQAFTFELRQGATAISDGTILETKVANAINGGQLTFTTQLVPGQTYQLCETIMPGWQSTFGTFVPGSFMPPGGVALDPTVDNSILCGNFTVTAGETKTFTIDNTPPPGGRALTIGFWKNWASCAGSNGKQKAVLDQTLASFPIASGQSTHGVYIGAVYVDTCAEAVALLNKTDLKSGKKAASDPLYNLAAQLMATELNFQAGAGKCPAVVTAEAQAQALLSKYAFNGMGSYTKKLSKADSTLATQLANTLDRYNNNMLC